MVLQSEQVKKNEAKYGKMWKWGRRVKPQKVHLKIFNFASISLTAQSEKCEFHFTFKRWKPTKMVEGAREKGEKSSLPIGQISSSSIPIAILSSFYFGNAKTG